MSDVRDQLAEALGCRLRAVIGRPPNPEMVRELTDALLPVVERIATERAAEALEAVAASPGRDVRQRCLNLAAALRSKS